MITDEGVAKNKRLEDSSVINNRDDLQRAQKRHRSSVDIHDTMFRSAGSRVFRHGRAAGDVRIADGDGSDAAEGQPLSMSLSAMFDGEHAASPERPSATKRTGSAGAGAGSPGPPAGAAAAAAAPADASAEGKEQQPVKLTPREFIEGKKSLVTDLKEKVSELAKLEEDTQPFMASPHTENPDIISLDLDTKLKEMAEQSAKLTKHLGEVRGCKMEGFANYELQGRALVEAAAELIAWHQALVEAARDTLKEQKKADSKNHAKARYQTTKHVKALRSSGVPAKTSSWLAGALKQHEANAKATLTSLSDDAVDPNDLAGHLDSVILLTKTSNLTKPVSDFTEVIVDSATKKSEQLHKHLANGKSGGNMAMLTLKEQEKESIMKADWGPWPAPDVEEDLRAPWVVAVLRHNLRVGVDKTPFPGMPMIVSAMGQQPVLLCAVSLKLLNAKAEVNADTLSKLFEFIEAAESMQQLDDVCSWVLLQPGRFVWIPSGFIPAVTTLADVATVLCIPMMRKDTAQQPLQDVVVGSISQHLKLNVEKRPFSVVHDPWERTFGGKAE